MGAKIYVGNLSFSITSDKLKELFSEFGEITEATVIADKFSGRSKGFGFVEMQGKAEAQSAIEGLNGKDLKGKNLNVNEARPRKERGRGGKRGGGRR